MHTYQCQNCFEWRFVSGQSKLYTMCGKCMRRKREGKI